MRHFSKNSSNLYLQNIIMPIYCYEAVSKPHVLKQPHILANLAVKRLSQNAQGDSLGKADSDLREKNGLLSRFSQSVSHQTGGSPARM
jgi:hypothetical protein